MIEKNYHKELVRQDLLIRKKAKQFLTCISYFILKRVKINIDLL